MTNLPSVKELRKYYKELKEKYFGDSVPDADEVIIEWSNRLVSSAGICYSHKKIIRLSVPYHKKFPEDIIDTLTHEMIHLITHGHGEEFKEWMDKINEMGGKVSLRSREPAVVKYVYRCTNCGKIFKLRTKLKYVSAYRCNECKKPIELIKSYD